MRGPHESPPRTSAVQTDLRLTNQAGPCVCPGHVKFSSGTKQHLKRIHQCQSQQTRVSHICQNLDISTLKFFIGSFSYSMPIHGKPSRQYLSSYPSPFKAILFHHPICKAICYKKNKKNASVILAPQLHACSDSLHIHVIVRRYPIGGIKLFDNRPCPIPSQPMQFSYCNQVVICNIHSAFN